MRLVRRNAMEMRRFEVTSPVVSRALPAVCGLALVCVAGAAAQAPGEPQTPSYQLSINVNKLLVPAVVKDAKGHEVGDLRQEDFQVFDDGKPRPISAFMILRRGLIDGDASAASQPAPTAASDPGAVVLPARITVFLFDDLHLNVEDLPQVRAAAAAMPGTLTGTDMAAVTTISGSINTGLTRDREKLQQALAKLSPHGIYRNDQMDCPHIDYYEADLIENKHDPVAIENANRKFANCNAAVNAPAELGGEANLPTAEHMVDSAARRALMAGHQDAQSTYASIRFLVGRLAQLPGQRTLILVSPGFLNVEQDALDTQSRIIDLAARSNVVISALDARGLYTTAFTASTGGIPLSGQGLAVNSQYHANSMRLAENAMAELADGTGGTYFRNNNDLEAGLKQMTEEPECVYLIELSLDGVKANGSYHRLKVKVDRTDVQVGARRGYFMAKPDKPKK
jgi:VWFA-related protein